MFPSPIGELHFSIKGYYHVLRLCKVFPSPIGELHFSIFRSILDLWTDAKIKVSVPYRGATFLNRKCKNLEELRKGFRPLSGSYISQ